MKHTDLIRSILGIKLHKQKPSLSDWQIKSANHSGGNLIMQIEGTSAVES